MSAAISSVALSGSFTTGGSTLPSSLSASSYQALKAMLVLSPSAGTAMAADASAGTSFNWAFTSGASGDSAFEFLREGETLTLTYTLTQTLTPGPSPRGGGGIKDFEDLQLCFATAEGEVEFLAAVEADDIRKEADLRFRPFAVGAVDLAINVAGVDEENCVGSRGLSLHRG